MKKLITTLLLCCLSVAFLNAQTAGDGQPCPGTPTVRDHEGNVYNTVKIGNQCWTKENLRTTTSPSTGTYLIPAASTSHTFTGKQAKWFDNDSATYAPLNYGLLYNWNAAMDTFNTAYGETSINSNSSKAVSVSLSGHRRGICPVGWHLPSKAEWTQLENYVSSIPEYLCDNSHIAKALASVTGWESNDEECCPGNQSVYANNTTGFSAVPAGFNANGYMFDSLAYFWSSKEIVDTVSHAYILGIRPFDPNTFGIKSYKTYGYSVRCIRDAVVYGDNIPCPGTPTVTDHEGNVYNTVKIGNQCWMKENLRTTTSPSTGTYLIPAANADYTCTGKQARWYNNDAATYAPLNYGLLYNWNAAVDTFNTAYGETSVNTDTSNAVSVTFSGHRRGICPVGWHLPSHAEWEELIDYVGYVPEYQCGGSGFLHTAKALASETGWHSYSGECYPGDQSVKANNATGFSAVPAGSCNPSFYNAGYNAYFWSATQNASTLNYAYFRDLHYNYEGGYTGDFKKYHGYSVRCLRDAPAVVVGDNTPCPGTPTVTDVDGNVYNTVQIGNQCWMKENLRTTHRADGTPIDAGANIGGYNLPGCDTSSTSPFYYNPSSTIPLAERGYFYNWPAAMVACPAGWHLPSAVEWLTLTHHVESQLCYTCDGNTDNIAKALASTSWWDSYENDDCYPGNHIEMNNATGFGAVPAGSRNDNSYFTGSKSWTIFWTSTRTSWYEHEGAFAYTLGKTYATVDRSGYERNWGMSVRCLRDEPSVSTQDGQPCPGIPTITDIDGNAYNTVRIGNQCWMKENLRTTHYPDGTEIPTGNYSSHSTSDYYDDNASCSVPLVYRGYGYSWDAAMHGAASSEAQPSGVQGVCPTGWHLPSYAEWTVFIDYMGSQPQYTCGGYPENIAKALASTSWWDTLYTYDELCAVNADMSWNNASGFSAVPTDEGLQNEGFWSSTTGSFYDQAWCAGLSSGDGTFGLYGNYSIGSASVRCLRNAPMGDAIPCPGVPTVKDHEGNVYNTVKIGNQCWTKENLRTTTSPSTGTYLIPAANTYYTYTGKLARWNNNDSATYAPLNYGLLYNWNAAVDTFNTAYGETSVNLNSDNAILVTYNGHHRGICPVGWHLPSDVEWMQLINYVGSVPEYLCGGNSDYIAKALASETGWNSSSGECYPGDQSQYTNNASGFSAVQTEDRGHTSFWSSTQRTSLPDRAYTCDLDYQYEYVYGGGNPKYLIYSVRCLRDPSPAVTTGSVLGVTTNSATCGGEVADDGGYAVTARGVCWSTSHNPTIANAHTSNGTGIGEFTGNITNLTPETTYYVRAYATNSEGTAYGEEVSFFTACLPENQCELTFVLTDSYGDGWNGNAIQVTDAETGTVLATMANEDLDSVNDGSMEETQTLTLAICDGRTVNFEWIAGNWSGETSYTVNDGNGEVIFSGSGGFSETYTYTMNCCLSPINITISDITNVSATIGWEGSNGSYQVRYRTPAVQGTFFEESFENGIPATWTTIDNDGDGHNWSAFNNNSFSHSGYGYVSSESFDIQVEEPLTPDNWLITPLIDLQGTMKVWLRAADPNYPDEHFAIYLSTTGNAVSDFTTTLVGESVTTNNTYMEYSADLSGYAGQSGYIAIRHFNCTDMDHLIVDDFVISGDIIHAGEWHTINSSNPSATLTGLAPATQYEVQVQGVCNGSSSEWSDAIDFETTFDFVTDLCSPEDQCQLTFVLTDSYGDSWNGNAILVMDAETGGILATMTNENLDGVSGNIEETQTVNLDVCNGRTVYFEWVEGGWPQETSYAVYDGNGEEIFSGAGGFTEPISYTVTCASPCPAISPTYTENFDSYTQSTATATGVEPDCWELVRTDASSMPADKRPQLCYNSSFAHSGNYSLKMSNRCVYAMPELAEDVQVNKLRLDMFLRQANARYRLEVGIWDGQTFVPVATFDNGSTDVLAVSCDFSSYTGNGRRVAFRNSLNDGSNLAYSTNYLDDITLSLQLCEAITPPYTENFDSFTQSTATATGVEPNCWELVRTDASSMPDDKRPQLCYNSSFAHSGSYSLKMSNRCVYAMPELSEDVQVNKLRLDMFLRQANARYRLEVGVWDGQTFVPVATFDNGSTDVLPVSCNFSSYTGNGRRIAFRNTLGDGSNLAYSTNYLDDITLTVNEVNCSITLPYSENFDSYTQSTATATGTEPTCWELVRTDATSMPDDKRPQLCYNSAFAHSGNYSLKMANRGIYAMPELELDEGMSINQVKLEMYLRQANAKYQLQVGVWDGQTFVPVATFNNSTTEVEFVTCNFSSYNGNGRRIAFRNTLGDGSNLAYSTNYLDDITLSVNTGTDCEAITLPYSENFDSYTQSTTAATGVQPDCWELVRVDAPSMPDDKLPQLYYNSNFAHSGAYSLKLYNRGVYAMPELELGDETSINQVKLEMYLRQANAAYQLQVGVWDGQTFVPVATFNNSTTNVEFVTCDFSNYNGNGNRIAFRNTLGSGTYAYSVNYLDDITLTVVQDCSIVLPYSEPFESYTTSTTAATGVQPDCWELVRTDAASMPDDKRPQIYYNSSFAHSGDYTLKMGNRCVYAMSELEPNVPVNQISLDMYLRQPNAAYQLEVGVWDGQMFVPVATFNNSTTGVEHVTCDFSSYNGNGRRVAFRNTLGNGKTWDYSYNYIDDINLTRIDNNKSADVTSSNVADPGMLGADRDMVDIVVYPNPTRDYINVEYTMNNVQCSGIEVIDVYGKVVRTVVGANNDSPTQINVSGLAAGMYFVRVTTEEGAVTKPFVKR